MDIELEEPIDPTACERFFAPFPQRALLCCSLLVLMRPIFNLQARWTCGDRNAS